MRGTELWYRATGLFYNLKIRHKLLLSYFFLIILPLGIMTFSSYSKSAGVIQNQLTQSAEQVLEQTQAFLDYKLDNISRLSNLLFTSPELHAILERDMDTYTVEQQIDDAKYLETYLKNLENNNNLLRIRLFVRDGLLYSKENINFYSLSSTRDSDWYEEINKANGKIWWSNVHPITYMGKSEMRIVSSGRLIRNIKNFNGVPSVVSIDIAEQDLLAIINKANFTKKGIVYLANSTGEIVCVSEGEELEPGLRSYETLSSLAKSNFTWEKIKINNIDVLTGSKSSSVNSWKLITIIPLKEMLSPLTRLWRDLLFLAILIGIITYSIAFYITTSNTRRMSRMITKMRSIQRGNLDARIVVDSGDEIGELQTAFNTMVVKLKQLMQERFEIGQEARSAELKALQAQINPHFLYNTLDLIGWKSKSIHSKEITQIVNALAKFYKISLSKGKETIAIQDELEHVKLYVMLQNMRYENRISLVITIDEEVYRYSTLKLILQPLAENAIYHGIMAKENKQGEIKISARYEGGIIILQVEDDGIGMTVERLNLLFSKEELSVSNGYGIRNINERIKMRYGHEFGLSFQSSLGKGTIATVRIKAEERS